LITILKQHRSICSVAFEMSTNYSIYSFLLVIG
jgi:hypothetical protein